MSNSEGLCGEGNEVRSSWQNIELAAMLAAMLAGLLLLVHETFRRIPLVKDAVYGSRLPQYEKAEYKSHKICPPKKSWPIFAWLGPSLRYTINSLVQIPQRETWNSKRLNFQGTWHWRWSTFCRWRQRSVQNDRPRCLCLHQIH